MEKKHTHSNKDFGYSVGKDAIFTKHLTNLSDQIIVLQKALANSRGYNQLKRAMVSNELDKILQNFMILSVFNANVAAMNGYTMERIQTVPGVLTVERL
jgi:hypothetical protein